MPKKMDRCVKKVKKTKAAKNGKINPYAVCTAALKKKKNKNK